MKAYSPRNFKGMHKWLKRWGRVVEVGGSKTLEVINFDFMVRSPVDRVVTNRYRKMNLAFAMAEWLSYMFDIDDVDYFERYIKDYGRYSSDGKHIDGAYGRRLHEQGDQIQAVIEKIIADPSTRQAVLTISSAGDLFGAGGRNTPCTLSIQFLLRDFRLNCITTMRSNDFVWGLTYDLFSFTMIQEYIFQKVKEARPETQIGTYFHHAGSFHMYDRHWDMTSKLNKDYRWPNKMDEMVNSDKALRHLRDIFVEPEKFNEARVNKLGMPTWHSNWAFVALQWHTRLTDPALSVEYYWKIRDTTLRRVMSAWLPDSEW